MASFALGGVREDIHKAKILYERGKLKHSAKILQRIMVRYPDNKAAPYLMGRIYFKSGQMRQAARFFKRSGPEFIDGASAFEFGISMFAAGDCTRAVKGFNKVSVDKQKDIASFYAGVCYYKMRDYFAAERAMRRARHLPPNFSATRRRILADIAKRNRDERLGAISQPVPYVPLPVAPQQPAYGSYPYYHQPYQPGLPQGPGAPKIEDYDNTAAAKKDAPPPKPTEGLSFSFTPKVEFYNETKTSNRHGRGEKTVTKQGPQGGGDARAVYRFAPDKNGSHIMATLPLSVTAQNLENNTKDVSYSTGEAGGEMLTTATETKIADKSIYYTLKPTLNVPVSESIDVEAGAHYGETLPDFKPDTKESEMGGFGSISVGIGADVNLKGNASMLQREKPNADGTEILQTSDQTFGGSADISIPWDLSLNLTATMNMSSTPEYETLDGYEASSSYAAGLKKSWETFSLGANVTQASNSQPSAGPISGTVDQLKIGFEGAKNFKIGLNIRLFGSYTMVNQYVKTGLCSSNNGAVSACSEAEQQIAEATGSRMGYGAEVKLTPVEWAYATANYSIEESQYAVKQAELAEDFQDKVVDYSTFLSILIGLSMSF